MPRPVHGTCRRAELEPMPGRTCCARHGPSTVHLSGLATCYANIEPKLAIAPFIWFGTREVA